MLEVNEKYHRFERKGKRSDSSPFQSSSRFRRQARSVKFERVTLGRASGIADQTRHALSGRRRLSSHGDVAELLIGSLDTRV